MDSVHRQKVIKAAKVLMVGAGGIGCELLKTLALSGFQDIHIIDMDTIEVSNLNRQFLFRQSHVGLSKSKVARDAVLKFRPHINITPHHANVKDAEFNVDFFKQFSVVLNGLDNLDARRHVNRLCLASEVPLIESGTTGFLGQVDVHIKGKTGCYECQEKPTPKSFPVCTITSTPSKFVHCIVWAKELLFAKLFGDKNQANDLNVHSNDGHSSNHKKDVFERGLEETFEEYGCRIYDHVFGYNIEIALTNEETWKSRNKPRPVFYRDVLPQLASLQNGISSNDLSENGTFSAMPSLGLKNPQEIWTLAENTKVFLETLKLFFEKREKDIGSLTFDKDDQLAVEFVTAAANIRASSFGIPLHSLFEAKGIAGNIVHAVATTNAIVAGLIVIEAIRILQEDSKYRMTYCLEHPTRKMLLMPVEPFPPNTSCYVCSETPLLLEINTRSSKLKDFVEKIVKNKLGMSSPLIMHGHTLIFEVGDDLEEDMVANYALNLEKVLVELPAAVTNGTILTVEDLQQELSCNISVKHREEFDEEKEPDRMVLSGWTQQTVQQDFQVENNGQSSSTDGMVFSQKTDRTSQQVSQADNSGGSSSTVTVTFPENEDLPDELEIYPLKSEHLVGSKRKLSEISKDGTATGKVICKEIDLNDDDDDDLVVLEGDPDPETSKKKKLWQHVKC